MQEGKKMYAENTRHPRHLLPTKRPKSTNYKSANFFFCTTIPRYISTVSEGVTVILGHPECITGKTSCAVSNRIMKWLPLLIILIVNSTDAINVAELKELRLKLLKGLQRQLMTEKGIALNSREGRQIESAEAGAVMYLPIGPGSSIRCPTSADAAAVSLAQMTFLATSMNIFSVVANISNNINNNNNNNNQVSYNVQSNNNIVTSTNVNNGNQVNVMVPVLNP
jgi:hypothetical protein